MGSIANGNHPLRLFVFDTPRTNCHVFYKMFCKHPQLAWARFFHNYSAAALYGPDRIQQRLRHGEGAEKTQIEWGTQYPDQNSTKYEDATKQLVEALEGTEKDGKIFFGKEHLDCLMSQDLMINEIRNVPSPLTTHEHSNPTYIPNEIMDTLTPIFVIRHPILMVDSVYRTGLGVMSVDPTDEDFHLLHTLRWCRILYDYFVDQGKKPVIVEAQDFIYKTKETMGKLCTTVGIDPEGIVEEWEPFPYEQFLDHKIAIAYTGDLWRSTGVERRSKEPAELTLTMDGQTEKWKKTYGDDIAAALRTRAEAEMPIYDYLRARKLQP